MKITTPLVIGHRGAAAILPENTLPSMRFAFEKFHSDMIEFDVHLSKDGIPVVIHDARLNRTTSGNGFVSDFSLEQLKTLDAGYYFDPAKNDSFPCRGKDYRIPALEELFTAFPDKLFSVEIKPKSKPLTRKVMEMISRFDAVSRSVVGSKHHAVAQELMQNYPDTARFASRSDVCRLLYDFRVKKKSRNDTHLVVSIPLHSWGFELDRKDWIDFLHDHGIRVFYWTINDEKTAADLALKGADGIISDDPGTLNRALGRLF